MKYLICGAFFLWLGCSLHYTSYTNDDSGEPELVFSGVNFNRYEDNKKTLELNAEKMEQYKDNAVYAKDLGFSIIEDGEVKTRGKCALLNADTDKKVYILNDSIEVENIKDELVVDAKNLKWDGQTEQLTSGRNDVVSINKGNTHITGSGFSASGVSKTFSFTGVITGETNTKDDDDKQDGNASNDDEQ